MAAICDINILLNGLYGKLVVYKTNIFYDVRFIQGMPWKCCSLYKSYTRAKKCFY